jgi:hypothetical protein
MPKQRERYLVAVLVNNYAPKQICHFMFGVICDPELPFKGQTSERERY